MRNKSRRRSSEKSRNQALREHLSHGDLLQLKRLNTPTIYNGWEQITKRDIAHDGFNLDEVRDFMPQMGPMVGYAVTVAIEPSQARHRHSNPNGWSAYRRYIAAAPGPKIVVVQDLDKPAILGAFWGEVNSNVHRALGCVGTITDGGIRDLDEMNNAGFKALARRLCVGHAFSHPVRWNCPVEVFGRSVAPGDLIHADKHGFLVIPPEDINDLLEAARFMDANECDTLISAARTRAGDTLPQFTAKFDAAADEFARNTKARFKRAGEW